MKKPDIPKNEKRRLKALKDYKILDTFEEQAFDDITILAAKICGVPIALISLIDEKRQWFKAHEGLKAREAPREVSFCGHAINSIDVFVVEDSSKDDRFQDNPLVTSDPPVCFYAGAPLTTPDGYTIGTLCVIDHVPRKLTEDQLIALKALARQVISQLELRSILEKLDIASKEMEAIRKAYLIIEFEPDGTIISANENFLTLFGYMSHEVLGKHHSIFIPYNQRKSEEYLQFWDAMRLGVRQSREFKRITKMETEVWIRGTYFPVHDDDGKIIKIIKTALNITEEKRKAADDQQKLNAISISSAVIEFDIKGNIIAANDKFLTLSEYALVDLIGKPHSILVSEATRNSREYRELWENLSKGIHQNGEFEGITKNGKFIYFSGTYNPIFDLNGKLYKFVEYALDVTHERKNSSNNREILRAIDRSTFFMELDLEGKIISINSNLLAFMKYSSLEVIGQNHSIFQSEQDISSGNHKDLWSRLKAGEFLSGDFHWIDKFGKDVWVRGTYNPVFNSNGQTIKFVLYSLDITENKQSEEKVRKAEIELTNFVNNAAIGIHWLDSAGTVLWANKAQMSLLGYSESEYIGQSIAKFHADALVINDIFLRLNREETLEDYEVRLIAKDHSLKVVAVTSSVYFVDGQFKHTRWFIRDITRQKAIALENETKQRELDQFFELSQDLLCVVGEDGCFKKINSSFHRVLGYSAEEILGRALLELVHPDDVSATTIELGKLSQGSSSITFGSRYRTKIGDYVYLSWGATPTPDGKLYAIARDTTKLNETERNLRLANRAVLNQKNALDSSAIVIETDALGKIQYVNDKILVLSGYNKAELFGEDFKIFRSDCHSDEFYGNLWNTVSQGKIWHGEIKNSSKNRTNYWMDTTIYPVLDESQKPQSYVFICFDVTEKKEALEKLQLASQQAMSAVQAKTDFLYTMSHEIRTPLNGIIGMTSILLETILTEEQKDYAETISSSGGALLNIVNDILDFSKIEAGKMDLEILEFNFQDYLIEILKPFQYSALSKGIACSVSFNDYPNFVFGDDGRIGQVISNLVSNAIKFTKEGWVKIRADLMAQDDQTALVIVVQDSGFGIPEEAKSRMFQAFSQAEKSTSRNFGGTGLGLSISKRMVEAMNGRISFESEYGKGALFKVELILKTGRAIESPSAGVLLSKGAGQEPGKSSHIGGRILVAEDNPTNQKVIARMLDIWGCKHLVVANGKEVLEALRNSEYDLILMDCQMPQIDGYEASRLIRKNPSAFNQITIVALTANAVEGDESKCREAGMNEYLSKPIEKNALEMVLRKYLKDKAKIYGPVLIDKLVLRQFEDYKMEGQPDILILAIESFLESSPLIIENLSKLVEQKDVQGAARLAHSLKSGALTLGAKLVGDFCQKIESFPEEGDYNILKSLFEGLRPAFLQSCAELLEIKLQSQKNLTKEAA